MTYTATLTAPEQARGVIRTVWPKVEQSLDAGKRLRLSISEDTKSREQEEHYHALIGEIHREMKKVGSKWTRDDWKRLLIDQWAQDSGQQGARVAPSLDGERVVQLGLQSRKFTVAQGSSFIEWLYAWGSERGIVFAE